MILKSLLISFTALMSATNSFSQKQDLRHDHPFLKSKERIPFLEVFKSLATPCIKDSLVYQTWNSSTSNWLSQKKYLYGYDAQLNCNIETYYTIYNSNVAIATRTESTYNTDKALTVQQISNWDNFFNALLNIRRTRHTYSPNKNLIETYVDQWNNNSNGWGFFHRSNYIYSSGILSNSLTENWNNSTSSWGNYSKTTFTMSGTVPLIEVYQNWYPPSTWKNSYRISRTYDVFNNLLSLIYQYWTPNNTWENSDKITFTYDGNHNVLSNLYKIWDVPGNTWKNGSRYTATYDSHNMPLTELNENYDQQSNSWYTQSKFLHVYTYDSKNNLSSVLDKSWNNPTNSFVNSTRSLMYYNCTTVGTHEISGRENTLVVYPNPANALLNIKTETDYSQILIRDIRGALIFSAPACENLNTSGLEKGIYFIQLLDKNKTVVSTQKFVKE